MAIDQARRADRQHLIANLISSILALDGAANGYTSTYGARRVVIDADRPPAKAAKPTVREASNVFLHSEEPVTEYVEHRGFKETEAEPVANVLAECT